MPASILQIGYCDWKMFGNTLFTRKGPVFVAKNARSQGLSVYIQGYIQVKLLSYPKQHVSCKAWVEYRLFHAPGNHAAKQNTKHLKIALFTRKPLFSNSAL